MARSLKKGPFIEEALLKKLHALQKSGQRQPIKTWSRRSIVTPEFVGYTVAVYDGRKHIPIFITENMVGHRFGEFAPTRFFRGHAGSEKTARR